ncbi:MAG: sigma-70 family RNA polymerase sigma factor [Mycoplasmataceae bacterium]|jgi:RNA polymerase primary sigma factor|nr:sigma-70 family RNA polymerase sigma factor [Mycoplasmataceae bacterium]
MKKNSASGKNTSSSDTITSFAIQDILKQLSEGKTSVLVSEIFKVFEQYSLKKDDVQKIYDHFENKKIALQYDMEEVKNKEEFFEYLQINNSLVNSSFKGANDANHKIFSHSTPLTIEEEVKYVKMLKSKDANDITFATNKLIGANLKLVYSIAKKYKRNDCLLEDLIQEGIIGLQDATKTYDYLNEKKARFSTYATFSIMKYITEYVNNTKNLIRLPISLQRVANIIMKKQTEMTLTDGGEPTVDALAKELVSEKIDREKIMQIKNLLKTTVSLDKQVGSESDDTLGDFVSEQDHQDEQLETEYKYIELYKAIHRVLNEEEELVVCMNHGLKQFAEPIALIDVAKKLNYSIDKVRQIKNHAEEKLAIALKKKFKIFYHHELAD